MKAGISQITFQLNAIQLGGEYSNEIISNAIHHNNFLVSKCTNNNIDKCLEHLSKLEKHFNDFSNVHHQSELYINLESFRYNYVIDTQNNQQFKNKLSNILIKIINLKVYKDVIEHIISYYPFPISELTTLHNEAVEQLNKMFEDNNLLKCFRLLDNKEICIDDVYNEIHYKDFIHKIEDFMLMNLNETVGYVLVKNGHCLPNMVYWNNEGRIEIRNFRNSFYIYNDLGLECKFTSMAAFECSDGINFFTFTIEEDDYYDGTMLICQNDHFSGKVSMYYELMIIREPNPYFQLLNPMLK
jgi:hypothetical protein